MEKKQTKTEKMLSIALKTSQFAKKKGIDLNDINPAFGVIISQSHAKNINKKKDN